MSERSQPRAKTLAIGFFLLQYLDWPLENCPVIILSVQNPVLIKPPCRNLRTVDNNNNKKLHMSRMDSMCFLVRVSIDMMLTNRRSEQQSYISSERSRTILENITDRQARMQPMRTSRDTANGTMFLVPEAARTIKKINKYADTRWIL